MHILHEAAWLWQRRCQREPVAQPNFSEHPDPDPLLAFFEESPDRRPAEAAETVEPAVNQQDRPVAAAEAAGAELRTRLERAERQIERALLDLSTLKSDLATLVGAVEDIKRRLSRPATQPAAVAAPPRRLSKPRTVAAIVLLLTAGAALWGVYSVATYDLPEPPPVEIESSSVAPAEDAAPASTQGFGGTGAVVVPATAPPPSAVATGPARAAPAPAKRSLAGNPAPRAVSYVGTLTVESDPDGDVYLNRKNVGRTPVRLEKLRAGSHLIWIERDGYRRWTRVVAVAADRVSRVSASLDPLSR
jgi:hypothetical protein